MRSIKRAFGALLVLAVAMAQQSCDNSYGIFSEVQKEIEQVGQDFFAKKSVSNIVRADTSYYAATTVLYARPVAGSSWSQMDIAGRSDRFVYGIAEANDDLYVSTDDGVFSYNGTTWTALTPPTFATVDGQSFYTDSIYSANENIYVVGHLYDESGATAVNYYCLYRWTGAAFDMLPTLRSPILGAGGILAADETIRGVAYDGGTFWFAAEDHLYNGATNTMGGAALVAAISDIYSLGSTRSNDVYIGMRNGNLYRDDNLTTAKLVSSETNPLTCVTDVPLAGGQWKLLVGTGVIDPNKDNEGYFEATAALEPLATTEFDPGKDGDVTSSAAIYATSVNAMPVHAFLYDGTLASGVLFIAISPYSTSKTHYGLYSSTWDGTTWGGWQAE